MATESRFSAVLQRSGEIGARRFSVFLNNDTEVMPSTIDALAGLSDRRADAGMVGARLVYPDGVLQEAGGIIWRDGSGSNYGNRDDPRKHQYNYVREVDYCSGAAIMLPRARWDEMGGFDEVFLPAYCKTAIWLSGSGLPAGKCSTSRAQ